MKSIPVRQVEPDKGSDKIYVRSATGFYQKIRTVSLWALMGLYFAICWIQVDGRPLIHFDLPDRQFHLFGATFWPQDFFILTLLLIICAFGLSLSRLSSAGSGVATPAPRPPGPSSSCGWRRRWKAAATSA